MAVTINSYTLGDIVRLSATFTVSGTDTNPTTVTCVVEDTFGTQTSLTPTNDGTGLYHADFTPTVSGMHSYRIVGTGSVVAATEGQFYVSASKIV